jgi:hypothetical protein
VIVFSGWTSVTVKTAPPPVGTVLTVPLLTQVYPGAVVLTVGTPNPPGRALFEVRDAATRTALATDYRFPAVRACDDPRVLAGYQNALLDALDHWHDTWTQDVTIGGTTYTLHANPTSQTLFDKMKLALEGLADQTAQFPLYTTTGPAGPFAARDLASALASYGAALLPRELASGSGFNALYCAVLAARAPADLDAISFGH